MIDLERCTVCGLALAPDPDELTHDDGIVECPAGFGPTATAERRAGS